MPEDKLYSNSIFWVEVEKIKPNPYQPRREFEPDKLRDLSESIKQYGVLQPLVVSRVEIEKEDGGIVVEYELIAGERRLRAARMAGLLQVPVIIRTGDNSMMKLELAIIENLQREDLNAVDRARAFERLVNDFGFTHAQIGIKVSKSREYVSNTLRILSLPEEILSALSEGKITEGHTRPLMMISGKPEEQMVLFKEIMYKKLTVREAEKIGRHIAGDKTRKFEYKTDRETLSIEDDLRNTLGTRVHIEKRQVGGVITIDFFSDEDLKSILELIKSKENSENNRTKMLEAYIHKVDNAPAREPGPFDHILKEEVKENEVAEEVRAPIEDLNAVDDRPKEEVKKEENEDTSDLYNIDKFSI